MLEVEQPQFTIVHCSLCTEQVRQQQRALKKTNRELERDRNALERQERQLVSNGVLCTVLSVIQAPP